MDFNFELVFFSVSNFMKYIYFLLIFFFSAVQCHALVGCLSSSTTYTYINPEGINRNGVPSYFHRYESDRRLTSSNFCSSPVSPSQGCYIYSTRSGYTSSPGTLVNYTTTNNCNVPIDDYVGLIVVSLAGLGFLVLRKSALIL